MGSIKLHLHCAALLAFLSLAGCSGGGGSTAPSTPAPTTSAPLTQAPPPTSAIPVNVQAPSTTVTYQAAAASATGTTKSISNVSISAVGEGAIITLGTDSSGNLSRLVIPAAGIDASINGSGSKGYSLADPATLLAYWQIADPLATTSIYNDTYGYALSQAAAGQGLTSSAYGIWASTMIQVPARTGTFAFGNLTPAASVPSTGSATFNGFTVGVGGASDGSGAYFLRGNAQIVTNFATQSVTTNLTNFTTANLNALSPAQISLPDLTGISAISGNAYAGAISGGGLSGTIHGNFYGSAAQETVGVWQASGGGNAWIGSFGAK